MKIDLRDQVALVTGAGSGIGKAIARALATNGATVVVNDVAETGDVTAREIRAAGGESVFIRCDVSDRGEVEQMVADACRKYGQIDILVNNAGCGAKPEHRVPVDQFSHEEWQRLVNVDLNSVFYCCRAVSPGMVERRKGNIINIASIAG